MGCLNNVGSSEAAVESVPLLSIVGMFSSSEASVKKENGLLKQC